MSEPRKEQGNAEQKVSGVGRLLFLIAGGMLLSIMVSCACGPIR